MTDARDDELVARVRAAMSEPGDRSPDLVDMIMTGYDLTVSDALVAELVEEPELVPVRSDEDEGRFFSFTAGDVSLHFEVLESSVLGEVEPATQGKITLQQADEARTADVSESGAFEVDRVGAGPLRLLFEPEEGAAIVTEWILP